MLLITHIWHQISLRLHRFNAENVPVFFFSNNYFYKSEICSSYKTFATKTLKMKNMLLFCSPEITISHRLACSLLHMHTLRLGNVFWDLLSVLISGSVFTEAFHGGHLRLDPFQSRIYYHAGTCCFIGGRITRRPDFGDNVYKHLKYEGGIHRVQLIPEVGLSSRMQRIHIGNDVADRPPPPR